MNALRYLFSQAFLNISAATTSVIGTLALVILGIGDATGSFLAMQVGFTLLGMTVAPLAFTFLIGLTLIGRDVKQSIVA